MDDHIPCIDNDPVGLRHAFSADFLRPARGKAFAEFFGHGCDVSRRCARSDDDIICEGGLSAQVDHLDILRLIIVERFVDKVFKGGNVERANIIMY